MAQLVNRRGFWEVVDLPELVGSPRQIEWAQSIRIHRAWQKFDDYMRMMSRLAHTHATWAHLVPEDWIDRIAQRAAQVFAEDRARWWIDHRYQSVHWMMGWRDSDEAATMLVAAALRV